MKIRPAGAELFLTVGRTDVMKLIVTFHNFYERNLTTDEHPFPQPDPNPRSQQVCDFSPTL